MDGEAVISHDVLASYAGDAVRDVAGVRGLVESPLPGRRGVRISDEDDGVRVEVHVEVEWGASIPDVGARVQQRVSDYLAQMADARLVAVDVVVDGVGAP